MFEKSSRIANVPINKAVEIYLNWKSQGQFPWRIESKGKQQLCMCSHFKCYEELNVLFDFKNTNRIHFLN